MKDYFELRSIPHDIFQEYADQFTDRLYEDLGPDQAIQNGMKWLCRAQDSSPSHDGGVSYGYHLMKGWMHSYPETTGYIVSTFVDQYLSTNNLDYKLRAIKMLDWLVSIQFDEGGFPGGKINDTPQVPVTFNTGQILIGLAHSVQRLGLDKYKEPLQRAASWLREGLDSDGCWRKYTTPFSEPSDKAYETHVSWGLFEAARIFPKEGYELAAMKQIDWSLTNQKENGWFDKCCLSNNKAPLTHTIGYVFRGLLEAYLFTQSETLLSSIKLTADHLMAAQKADGRFPGRLNANWRSEADWVCLTGNVQIAHCYLLLYQITQNDLYLTIGKKANAFVRKTLGSGVSANILGAVKGSFPIQGRYQKYTFPNWATKFMVDSNQLEIALYS